MRAADAVMAGHLLASYPVHLGRGGTATAQPLFSGMDWYAAYTERPAPDGQDGWLVSLYRFEENWDSWEVHPNGHEVVLCIEGSMTLYQEDAQGERHQQTLGAGDYAINPPGAWHTADVAGAATALFITAGDGTAHRAR